MNDSLPHGQRLTPEFDPSRMRPTLDGPGLIKLILIVIGSIILTIVTLSMLFAFLGPTKGTKGRFRSTTQVRGITQGMFTYAGGNKERMPGTDSKGFLVVDDTENTGDSGDGSTVEGRFWIMLDENAFTGEYIISPSETKTNWTTGAVSSDNYSFALLNIHDGATSASTLGDKIRPSETGRSREWKQSINTQSVLIADRARIPGGYIGDNYDKIYSVHTTAEDERWAGSVGRGDGSASFENESALDTRYGKSPEIEADRMFSRERDVGRYYDNLPLGSYSWDTKSNALLGYTSVGYEDGDIASD